MLALRQLGISPCLLPTGSSGRCATTITITNLTPNNNYRFTIVASDAAGNWSAPSPEASVRTLRYTAGPMCSVTYQPITSGGGSFSSQVAMTNLTTGPWQEWTLAFTLAPGQTLNPAWGFQQNGSRWSITFVWLFSSGAGPLMPGATRTVAFSGTYAGADNPPPTDFRINDHPCTVTGVTVPPSPPGNLTASNVTSGSVTLTWTASTPGTNPIAGYEVLVSGFRYTCIGVNPLACLVTGLAPGASYAFSVRAVDTTGLVGAAATIVVQTPAVPRTCTVAYAVTDWGNGSGFTGNVTITNSGTSVFNGWMLRFNFPAGQRVVQGWGATWTQPAGSSEVSAASLGWNATIQPGASVSIGISGSYSGSNPEPTAFTLNSAPCTVA